MSEPVQIDTKDQDEIILRKNAFNSLSIKIQFPYATAIGFYIALP